jgi:hypothetical protein
MLLAAWCKAVGRYFTPILSIFCQNFHFGLIPQFQKATINLVMSVCLSLSDSTVQVGCHGTDLYEIILEEFSKICRENSSLTKFGKTGTLLEDLYTFMIYR